MPTVEILNLFRIELPIRTELEPDGHPHKLPYKLQFGFGSGLARDFFRTIFGSIRFRISTVCLSHVLRFI